MIAATEDDMDEHVAPSVLSGIKEKLVVIDLINQLDIADVRTCIQKTKSHKSLQALVLLYLFSYFHLLHCIHSHQI